MGGACCRMGGVCCDADCADCLVDDVIGGIPFCHASSVRGIPGICGCGSDIIGVVVAVGEG